MSLSRYKTHLVVLALGTLGSVSCGHHQDQERPGTPAAEPAPSPAPVAPVAPMTLGDNLPSNEAVANYRGFTEVDGLVRERLTTSSFQLRRYLGDRPDDLVHLLGDNLGNGQHSTFENGQANAINIVLWHMTLTGVAHDLALACTQVEAVDDTKAAPSATFAAVLKPLCAWPNGDSRKAPQLGALWSSVMAADAPQSEEDAFFAFAQSPDMAQVKGADAVETLLGAMLLNPHFLIRQ